MKKLILPFFALFCIFLLSSAAKSHDITSYYSSLYLDLDRHKYYEVQLGNDEEKGYGEVKFKYIKPGTHRLRIYEVKTYHDMKRRRTLIYDDYIRFHEGCEVYGYFDRWNDKLYFDHKNCDDDYKKKRWRNHLSDREFREALDVIKNQSFESGRETVAKEVIDDYDISVDQLVDILNVFWFETTKLSLAKYAYDHMEDTRGFYKVYNVFSFSSSVDELRDYIESRGKNSSDW